MIKVYEHQHVRDKIHRLDLPLQLNLANGKLSAYPGASLGGMALELMEQYSSQCYVDSELFQSVKRKMLY